jgi:hypothetical protein
MKIRTHRDPVLTLESTAITDIILNIFIFFFTAFSLVYTFNPMKESSPGRCKSPCGSERTYHRNHQQSK